MKEALLTGINILKRFKNSNFVLDIPQIHLKEDTITGVVGENGNGKTTLLNILAGNLESEHEKLCYFGKEPSSANDWFKVKDKIAFIPQRIPKWYGTLRQNLQLKASLEKIPKNKIDEELERVLSFLDLKKYAHLKWSEISTGYRLRFELARVLIGQPQLLILDEPIANLDIKAQQKFLSDIKELVSSKEYPIAIILSSQQLHEIETVADNMIFLKEGKALFSGNVNELIDDSNIVELLVTEANTLEKWLLIKALKFSKNGVYHQIDLGNQKVNDFLKELIAEDFEINYFRNISKSTKKLF